MACSTKAGLIFIAKHTFEYLDGLRRLGAVGGPEIAMTRPLKVAADNLLV